MNVHATARCCFRNSPRARNCAALNKQSCHTLRLRKSDYIDRSSQPRPAAELRVDCSLSNRLPDNTFRSHPALRNVQTVSKSRACCYAVAASAATLQHAPFNSVLTEDRQYSTCWPLVHDAESSESKVLEGLFETDATPPFRGVDQVSASDSSSSDVLQWTTVNESNAQQPQQQRALTHNTASSRNSRSREWGRTAAVATADAALQYCDATVRNTLHVSPMEARAFALLTQDEERLLLGCVRRMRVLCDMKAAREHSTRGKLTFSAWASLANITVTELRDQLNAGFAARARLAYKNIGLVIRVSHRYRRGIAPLDDVIAEGMLGLLHAIDKFDPKHGTKLATYATWWIRSYMGKAQVRHMPLKVPCNTFDLALQILQVQTQLSIELGRDPTEHEVAQRMRSSVKRVRSNVAAMQVALSLDAHIAAFDVADDDACHAALEKRDPMEAAVHAGMHAVLDAQLCQLTPQEAAVVRYRYGLDGQAGRKRSYSQCGDVFQVSESRARCIVQRALSKLRANASDELHEYSHLAAPLPKLKRRSMPRKS